MARYRDYIEAPEQGQTGSHLILLDIVSGPAARSRPPAPGC
jgi:hypothetical protein